MSELPDTRPLATGREKAILRASSTARVVMPLRRRYLITLARETIQRPRTFRAPRRRFPTLATHFSPCSDATAGP